MVVMGELGGFLALVTSGTQPRQDLLRRVRPLLKNNILGNLYM